MGRRALSGKGSGKTEQTVLNVGYKNGINKRKLKCVVKKLTSVYCRSAEEDNNQLGSAVVEGRSTFMCLRPHRKYTPVSGLSKRKPATDGQSVFKAKVKHVLETECLQRTEMHPRPNKKYISVIHNHRNQQRSEPTHTVSERPIEHHESGVDLKTSQSVDQREPVEQKYKELTDVLISTDNVEEHYCINSSDKTFPSSTQEAIACEVLEDDYFLSTSRATGICVPQHKRTKGGSRGGHLKHRQTRNIVTRSKSFGRLEPFYCRMLHSSKTISCISRGFGRAPMLLRPNKKYTSVFPKRRAYKRRNRKQKQATDNKGQNAQCKICSTSGQVQLKNGKQKQTGFNTPSMPPTVEKQCWKNKSQSSEQNNNTPTCAIHVDIKCNDQSGPLEIEQFCQMTAKGNSSTFLKAQKSPSLKHHHTQTKKVPNRIGESGSDASDSRNQHSVCALGESRDLENALGIKKANKSKCNRESGEWSVLQEISDVSSHQLVPSVQDIDASAVHSDTTSITHCQTRSNAASSFAPKKVMMLQPYMYRCQSVACKPQLCADDCKHWLLIQRSSQIGQQTEMPETENREREENTRSQAVSDYAPKTLMMLRPYKRYGSIAGKSLMSHYDTGHWLLGQIQESDLGHREDAHEPEKGISDHPVKEDNGKEVKEPPITSSKSIIMNPSLHDDDSPQRAVQAEEFIKPDEKKAELMKAAESSTPNAREISKKTVHKGFKKPTKQTSSPKELSATQNREREKDPSPSPTDSHVSFSTIWQTRCQAVSDYAPKTLMMLRPYKRYGSIAGKSLMSHYDTGHWLLGQIQESDLGHREDAHEPEKGIPDHPVKEDNAKQVKDSPITSSNMNPPLHDDDTPQGAVQAGKLIAPDDKLSKAELRKEAEFSTPNARKTSQKAVHKGFKNPTKKLSGSRRRKVAESDNLHAGEIPQRTLQTKRLEELDKKSSGPQLNKIVVMRLKHLPAKELVQAEGLTKPTENSSGPHARKAAESNDLRARETPQNVVRAEGLACKKTNEQLSWPKPGRLANSSILHAGESPQKVAQVSRELKRHAKRMSGRQLRKADMSNNLFAEKYPQKAVHTEGLRRSTEKSSDQLTQVWKICTGLQKDRHEIKTTACNDQEIVPGEKNAQQKQSDVNSDQSVPFMQDSLLSQTISHEVFSTSCRTRTQEVSDYAPKTLMMLQPYTNYRSIAGKLELSNNETGHWLLAQIQTNGTGREKIVPEVEKIIPEYALKEDEANNHQAIDVKTRCGKDRPNLSLSKCHVGEPLQTCQKAAWAKRSMKPTEKPLGYQLRKKSRHHRGAQPLHACTAVQTGGVQKPTEVLSRPHRKKVAKSSSLLIGETPQKAVQAKIFTKPTVNLSRPHLKQAVDSGSTYARALLQKAVNAERFGKSAVESPELHLGDVVKSLDAHAKDASQKAVKAEGVTDKKTALKSPRPQLGKVSHQPCKSATSLRPMQRQRRRCHSVFDRATSNHQLAKTPHKGPSDSKKSKGNVEECSSSAQLQCPSSKGSSNCSTSHLVSGDKQSTLAKQNRLHKVCLDIHVRCLSVLLHAHRIPAENIDSKFPSDMSESTTKEENTAIAAVMDSKFETTDITDLPVDTCSTTKSLDDRDSAISSPLQSSLENKRNCMPVQEECNMTNDSASCRTALEKEKNGETEQEEHDMTKDKISSCTSTEKERNSKSELEEGNSTEYGPTCLTLPEKDRYNVPASEGCSVTKCRPVEPRRRTTMKLRKKDKHFLFSRLGFKKTKQRVFHIVKSAKPGSEQNLVRVRTHQRKRQTSPIKQSKQTDFQHHHVAGASEMVQPNEDANSTPVLSTRMLRKQKYASQKLSSIVETDTLFPLRRGRPRKHKQCADDSTPGNFILPPEKRNREELPLPQHPELPLPQHPELPLPQHPELPLPQHPELPLPQHPESKKVPNGLLSQPNQARGNQSLKSSRCKKQDSRKQPRTRQDRNLPLAGTIPSNPECLPLSKRIRQLISGYSSPDDEEEFTLEEFCSLETLEEAVEMAARAARSEEGQEPHHHNASSSKTNDSESLSTLSSSNKERRSKRSSRSPEGSYWDCSVCTYRNKAEAFKCAMCDVRKGTSTRKPRLNAQLVAQQQAQQNLSPLIHVKPVKTTPRGPAQRKAGTPKKPRPRLKNVDRSTAISTEVIVNNVPVIITEFKEKSHTRTTVDSDEASADRTNGNVNGL